MKLKQLKLKNFRGYNSDTYLEVSDLTALIGKNDAGKSTILEALEIFFNNKLVVCEREDLSVKATSDSIEISCIFSDFPDSLTIDTASPTTLEKENLLNQDGLLEIKKVFKNYDIKPDYYFQSGQWDLIVNMATYTNGVALLPKPFNGINTSENVVTVDIKPTIPWEIVIAYNQHIIKNSDTRKVEDFFINFYK